MDFEESGSQSLLVIMASKICFLQFWKRNFLLCRVNFLSILSIVASYVKSMCRALDTP